MHRCIPIFNKPSVSNNFIPFGRRDIAYNLAMKKKKN